MDAVLNKIWKRNNIEKFEGLKVEEAWWMRVHFTWGVIVVTLKWSWQESQKWKQNRE